MDREKLEMMRRDTERAYVAVLNAMLDLVNAITEERDYFRDRALNAENLNPKSLTK